MVKFNGGNNVGYIVVVGDEKYVLYLLFFGIFLFGVMFVIGNGVVIDFEVFFFELEVLFVCGIDVLWFKVSVNVYIIM